MEYKSKDLVKGFIWSGVDKLGIVFLMLALELVLARLLLPKDYGVIGVVLVFISLAITFSEGGFTNALIQNLDRTEVDYSTVFYFNLAASILIVIVLYFLAPSIERFFRIPDLTLILRVISLSIILNSIVMVHKVKLSIKMDFKTQAKYSLVAVLLSGVLGIYLAYEGYGVWALVMQNIFMAFFNAVFFWFGVRWFPTAGFSFISLKKLFAFGSNILASALLQAAYFNAYPIVIGRALSTRDLGLYSKTNQFTQMPASVLTTIVQRVLFPFFSSHQSNNEKIATLNDLFTKLSCLLFFPLFFILAIVAQPLIIVLFSEKWAEMTDIFIIFCIAYTFYPITVNNMMIFQIKNKTALFLRIEIFTKIIGVTILLLTYKHGLVALAYGILVNQFLQFLISSLFIQKLLDRKNIDQIKVVISFYLFSFLLLFFSKYYMNLLRDNILLNLLIGFGISLILYLVYYLIFYRKFVNQIILLVKTRNL
ncbi:lipopolysaccharide biosynthesis protein [Chryseobacterium sp. MP_3.2]|uniref:lipopolysaccharide biosynthesis protein n=1 Tax=Chryseobacterium sp. MP_3.2 TaxID=3071712 RepID=UPI002DFB1A52|nr:teichuronic acid exporter [Chryseobacterium sp. MP_3.2]